MIAYNKHIIFYRQAHESLIYMIKLLFILPLFLLPFLARGTLGSYRNETPVMVRALLQSDADGIAAARALQSYTLEPVQVAFRFPTTAQGNDGGGGMFTLRQDSSTTVYSAQLQASNWPTPTYTHIEATIPYAIASNLPPIAGIMSYEVADPFFMWAAYPKSRPW